MILVISIHGNVYMKNITCKKQNIILIIYTDCIHVGTWPRWKEIWVNLNNSPFNILWILSMQIRFSPWDFFFFSQKGIIMVLSKVCEWTWHWAGRGKLLIGTSLLRTSSGKAALYLHPPLSAQPVVRRDVTNLGWRSGAPGFPPTASLLLSRRISPSTWQWKEWCLMSLLERVSGSALWILTSGELGSQSGHGMCEEREGTLVSSFSLRLSNNLCQRCTSTVFFS